MSCTCANAGAAWPAPDSTPARLMVISDDERIGEQLALLGHTVFTVRPSRHPDGPTPAMLTRFAPDAVVGNAATSPVRDLPYIRVTIPDVCDDCVSRAHQPAIAAGLDDSLRALTARSGARDPRRVIISGYYGAKNTGDNLLLEAIARAIETHDPRVVISVAATNPTEVERAHGLPAYSRKDLPLITRHLDTCSGFVLGGGGLWNDYNFNELGGVAALFGTPIASIPGWTQTQLLARLLGSSTHGYGLGVGPLTDAGARELVHLAATGLHSLVVRDDESAAILRELDIDANVAPDPVYGLSLPNRAPAPVAEPYIALNLRDWQFDDDGYERELRAALAAWCRRTGYGIVGVPMQPSDVKTLQAFLAELPADIATTTLRWQHDPAQLLSALEHAAAVVAMRLHACLLAHRLGRGVVGLCYDPKVSQHFAQLHRDALALGLGADAQQIGTALDIAAQPLPGDVVAAIRAIEIASNAGLKALAQRIADAPPKRVLHDRRYDAPSPVATPAPKGFLARMRG